MYGREAGEEAPRCKVAPFCHRGVALPQSECHGLVPARSLLGRLPQVPKTGQVIRGDGAALLAAIQTGQTAYRKGLSRADTAAAVLEAGTRVARTHKWRDSAGATLALEVVFGSRIRDLEPLFAPKNPQEKAQALPADRLIDLHVDSLRSEPFFPPVPCEPLATLALWLAVRAGTAALRVGLSPFQTLCVIEHEGSLAYLSLPREDRVPAWKSTPLFPVAVLQVLGLDDPTFEDDAWTGFKSPVPANSQDLPDHEPPPPVPAGRFVGATLAVACAAGKKAAGAMWDPVAIKSLIFELGAEILGASAWCASPYFRKALEQVARSHCGMSAPSAAGGILGDYYLSVDQLRALPYVVDLYANQAPHRGPPLQGRIRGPGRGA